MLRTAGRQSPPRASQARGSLRCPAPDAPPPQNRPALLTRRTNHHNLRRPHQPPPHLPTSGARASLPQAPHHHSPSPRAALAPKPRPPRPCRRSPWTTLPVPGAGLQQSLQRHAHLVSPSGYRATLAASCADVSVRQHPRHRRAPLPLNALIPVPKTGMRVVGGGGGGVLVYFFFIIFFYKQP
jgi:hypothetical protein